MFYNNDLNMLKLFVLQNFPFVEKDFDALSDYQILCKIFEYFEKQIKDLEDNYSGIDEQISDLKAQFNQLKIDIQNELAEFKQSTLNDVNTALQNNYNQVIQLLSDYQTVFNSLISNLRNDFEAEIERIELGDVKAYNPTTGEIENISKVIMDVYEILRQNAINCTEFDGLELTATEFDAKELTAYNFDVNGKSILIVN